jgi:hypothetical protein
MALKHVGRVIKTKKKCAVAYRVVPGDPNNCLIVMTESLDAGEHDTLMNLIESQTGQDAYELGEAMARTQLPDGRNMLAGFHTTGKFQKVQSNLIEMTPNNVTSVPLDELNKNIAEQKGVTVADLALKGADGQTVQPKDSTTDAPVDPTATYTTGNTDNVLTDEALAAQYRSQADSLFKEAKRLREQAEELVPTKRKSKSTVDG